MLVHENLDTLKHYVRPNIADIQATHRRTHPREIDEAAQRREPDDKDSWPSTFVFLLPSCTGIRQRLYSLIWTVEYTDEFGQWWETLTSAEQVAVDAGVRLLEELGPGLSRPYVDTVKGSRYATMKELRTQCRGRPLRTLFAFDPRRTAILLVGGDKGSRKRFYSTMVPLADRLYDQHLEELRKEGHP